MPLGFHSLHDVAPGATSGDNLVDIVAVHDVLEDSFSGWIDSDTGINWLRDFLPEHIRVARVVTYGYSTSASAMFATDAPETIQRMAESFVQELHANRRFAETKRRPIIFLCHGFGGVLVKKSLLYSFTRTAPKVVHLWDHFVSTFAILFFGTPHARVDKSNWLEYEAMSSTHQQSFSHWISSFRGRDEADCQMSQLVDKDFAPFVKQFHMFFFWEQLPTSFKNGSGFLVDSRSAAPTVDNTETAGIHATHFGMTKFNSKDSSDYRTVVAALSRYCESAPRIISHRWRQAEAALKELRVGEARELGGFGFDVRLEKPFRHRSIPIQRHFHLPDEATTTYIGRQDLLRALRKTFFPSGFQNDIPGRKSFVVCGIGGCGKTELCSKFAHDNKHEYTAVFTIRAASAETVRESFSKIGELASLEPTERAGRHYLDQQSGPWLLIIDNADDPSLDLHRLFPSGEDVHILVTTRNRDFCREGTLGFFELNGLKEEEALQLLLGKADIPRPWDLGTTKEGSMIAEALGYLAIALIQAGNCIYRGVCELGGYLALHKSARNRHRDRGTSPDRDKQVDIIKVVYSTFDVSMQLLQIEETEARQDAADLLRIIAFFHFELIPVEIFSRAITKRKKSSGNLPTESWTANLIDALRRRIEPPTMLPSFLKASNDGTLDEHRINWAIALLRSLSLIRYDGREISLHPLIHAWARDSLTIAQRHIWASIALNALMESISLPPVGNSETDGAFHRELLPHLDACLAETGNPIPSSTHAIGKVGFQIAMFSRPTLLLIIREQVQHAAKCGWVFAERGRFKTAAMHLRMAKDVLIQMLGEDNERTMSAMLGLAGVCWGLGRLEEAIDLQRSVVETRSRIFGPGHEQTLQAMDQLGRSYWLHGQYHEALALQQVTADRMRLTLEENHPQTLAALDNLGVTLGAWHRYEESLEVHQEVLAARTKAFGDTHLDTLTTKANLAMALLDLGRLQEAKDVMVTVFDQRRTQLGKEHPWTLWAVCYLAKIDIEMNLLVEAEEMLDWGIEAGIRSLSKDHLGVLMGRGQLARVYARTGRLDQAEKLCLDVVEKLEDSRGIEHPDSVYALWKLAQLYVLKDNPAQAIRTCELGLQRADMRITRKHPIAKDIQELLDSLRATTSESDLTKPVETRNLSTVATTKGARLRSKNQPTEPPRTLTW